MKDVIVTALEKDVMRKKSMAYKKGSKRVEQEYNRTLSYCYPQHNTLC